MSIGGTNLSTNQKRENGPPFSAASANNGVSVDLATGKLVLGNDVGDPLSPAQLLSFREINTNGFSVNLVDVGISQNLRADGSIINGIAGSAIAENRRVANDIFNFAMSGAGSAEWSTGPFGGIPCLLVVTANGANTGKWQLGPPINTTKNPATLQVNGSISGQAMARTMSNGTFAVDRTLDSNAVITNPNATGLVTVSLPNMAFSGTTGFHIYVLNLNALGITIQMFAGATGFLGTLATSAGGTISTTDVGSGVHLFCANATTWVASGFTGNWILA